MSDNETQFSRRRAIAMAAATPVALLFARSAMAQEACFNPARLPAAQRSLRNSLEFKMQSPDAARACAGCAFFTGTRQGCGTCMLLSNGPVSAQSTCNSFAPKE